MTKDILIFGDNLDGLGYLLEVEGLKGRVDLVYIDPPFATNSSFTITDGRASTISNSRKGDIAYTDHLLGNDFISYIKERLLLVRELLSEKGSIYLHTDYKIGHYVKVMMDEVFGADNFINDITRVKCNPKNFPRVGYGNIKDMILFYSKGQRPIWHEPKEPYTREEILRLYPKTDKDGRHYATVPLHAPGESLNQKEFKGMLPPAGRHWRTDVETMNLWDAEGLIEWSGKGNPRKIIYADDRTGKRIQDIWSQFKDPQYPVYPTEKNPDLANLIVKTSSDPRSIVLDCFCGSGTTLKSAAINGRRWIGIDSSESAIEATRSKLGLTADSMSKSWKFIDLSAPKGSED